MSNNLICLKTVINFVLNFDYKVGGSKRVERRVTTRRRLCQSRRSKAWGIGRSFNQKTSRHHNPRREPDSRQDRWSQESRGNSKARTRQMVQNHLNISERTVKAKFRVILAVRPWVRSGKLKDWQGHPYVLSPHPRSFKWPGWERRYHERLCRHLKTWDSIVGCIVSPWPCQFISWSPNPQCLIWRWVS